MKFIVFTFILAVLKESHPLSPEMFKYDQFLKNFEATGRALKQEKTKMNGLILKRESTILDASESELMEFIGTFCEKMITKHLKRYTSNFDDTAFRNAFNKTLASEFGKTAEPASSTGCNLMAVFDKVRFIFEFAVNETSYDCTSGVENYLPKFSPSKHNILLMRINYRYASTEEESATRNKLICSWSAALYRADGSLRGTLPQQQLTYLEPVPIKQKSVHDDYVIMEVLGSGGLGVVRKCREKRTGNIFAAKIVDFLQSSSNREGAYREIEIMNQLNHPNLLSLYDVYEYDGKIAMIFEYLSGGTLRQKKKSPEAEVLEYARQICDAVLYMHERDIFHCDICVNNILCETNQCRKIKLSDFNVAVQYQRGEDGSSSSTLQEHLRETVIGRQADMWYIGEVVYFLISGIFPYEDEGGLGCIEHRDMNFDSPTFRNVSTECIDFLRKLLIKDDKKRMNIHEAMSHPWMKNKLTEQITARKKEGTEPVKRYDYSKEDREPVEHLLTVSFFDGAEEYYVEMKRLKPSLQYPKKELWKTRQTVCKTILKSPYFSNVRQVQQMIRKLKKVLAKTSPTNNSIPYEVYKIHIRDDSFHELMFRCPAPIHKLKSYKQFYISREYHIRNTSVRFVFTHDDATKELSLAAIAEEPALISKLPAEDYIYEMVGERYNYDYMYEKLRNQGNISRAICNLAAENRFRLCGLILNAKKYRKRIIFSASKDDEVPRCEIREFCLQRHSQCAESFALWVLKCKSMPTRKSMALKPAFYYISLGLHPEHFFISQEKEGKNLIVDHCYLPNLSL